MLDLIHLIIPSPPVSMLLIDCQIVSRSTTFSEYFQTAHHPAIAGLFSQALPLCLILTELLDKFPTFSLEPKFNSLVIYAPPGQPIAAIVRQNFYFQSVAYWRLF